MASTESVAIGSANNPGVGIALAVTGATSIPATSGGAPTCVARSTGWRNNSASVQCLSGEILTGGGTIGACCDNSNWATPINSSWHVPANGATATGWSCYGPGDTLICYAICYKF